MRILSRLHHSGLYHRNKNFLPVFLAGLFSCIHYALIIYINSSYLEQFFSQTEVAGLFALGALLFLIALLTAETFFEHIKLHALFVISAVLEILAIYLLVSGGSQILIGLGFIIHEAAVGFLFYVLDVMLEKEMRSEKNTGEVRGIYLTVSNAAFVLTPIIMGFVLGNNNFVAVYLLSIFMLFLAIPVHFSRKTEHYIDRISHPPLTKDIRISVFLNFLLQFFFAWMVTWSPIYLNQYMGFSWPEIGIIFSIMLLPFALFELPLGELADHMFGEKEIMAIGFFIIAIATAILAIITSNSLIIWAAALFFTRVGASAIEISTESYFFKHVKGHSTGTIGLFRAVRPVALILAPLAGALSISLFGFGPSFAVLGAIMFLGVFGSMRIKDTL